MEAKDTVMNDEQMYKLIASKEQLKLLKQFGKAQMSEEYHILIQAQAKISFKLGQENEKAKRKMIWVLDKPNYRNGLNIAQYILMRNLKKEVSHV